ncbi:ATP-binding cassette subfamily C protein LapB [Chitinivorax tropicus]|uniref:Cyclolysin secretion/processing ATP-binding protein CyaB n=1 Tax=Chitinivorax tropicus TaxID=714531 RepID=A0A840MSP0_9PROT|nr:type I secretion system permease/ATPase [Chitinivorax tropicus]MBB5018231.1 ATP-binding cassette subfamily C protein LapB [Chitinivorax tropicus]
MTEPHIQSDPFAWHVSEHESHLDPLLDCLAALTHIHGHPWTREALSAGLSLVDNKLPPSQFSRAASRAGLTTRFLRRSLDELPEDLFPTVLLLDGRRACLVLAKLPDGRFQIRLPEGGESGEVVTKAQLKGQYTGVAIIVRPRFRLDERTPELHHTKGRHWFWSTVWYNWRLYRDATLAALLINLFALAMPLFTMNVYDRVVPNRAEETLWVLAIGVMGVLLFDFLLKNVRAYIVDTAGKRIDVTLSALIMERVLGIRMDARPASVGSFAANLRAFETVRDFFASATLTALVDLPFILLFLLALLWISPWLVLPPLVGMLLVLLFSLFAQEKMRELSDLTIRASAQRNATLVESLVGLETIKVMGAEGHYQRLWERTTVYLAQIGARLKMLSGLSSNFAQLIQQLVSIVTVMVGVYLAIDAKVSMGGIIAASMLAGRAMAPLGMIAGLLMQYQNARTSLQAVESHMQSPVERPEDNAFLHRPHLKGEIEFRNVTFSYPGQEAPTLRDISFKLAPGEKVAIIGRIGSGKSTIEKLVLGLYQPTEGAVLIDGIDTRQIDPAELRRATGYVPQDVTLFYGTLRQNIAMGAPFADDARIIAAAGLAGVTDFANLHPRGFDMPIGERGESLSGGQRQAVAIARAVLSDPPMLLLDEPSSSMDHQSEERFKHQLKIYSKHKTIILVTHRTSLLDLVDRLIVMDNGKIVADGPKDQVIEALQRGRIGRGV